MLEQDVSFGRAPRVSEAQAIAFAAGGRHKSHQASNIGLDVSETLIMH